MVSYTLVPRPSTAKRLHTIWATQVPNIELQLKTLNGFAAVAQILFEIIWLKQKNS